MTDSEGVLGRLVTIKIGACATVKKRVVLPLGAMAALKLRVIAEEARVFSRDYIFSQLRVLNLAGEQGAVVGVELMVNKLRASTLKMKGSMRTLTGRVMDTAVNVEEATPWTGSVIELF